MEDFVVGWSVDPACRAALLQRLPARYPRVIAHHVTLKGHVGDATSLPPSVTCRIVGEADDGQGVQAMVVEIDGSAARPDGGTFHITWSLAEGRHGRESNAVIAAVGWTALEPLAVTLRPARFPR